ncbi:unnamed protein product [Schistosoma bovis]|nr:unnamed protein product [Schistosoma bovis]
MNLEGAGAAKRLMLFQTGPGPSSDVLLEAYASAFKQPFASVLGEDVFQFGLVPSDTDYRIFRDYGLVPGLDLAYIQDGIWQHNTLDYFYSLETDFFDSGVFLIALQSFLLSLINAPSSYVYTFWVAFGLIFKMSDIRNASPIKLKFCQTVRFVSFLAVTSMHTYNLNLFLNFMIPIMGRSGHAIKPDLFLSCCIFIIMLPVMLPSLGRLQCTSRTGSKYLFLMLLNACLSYAILIHASNYGFPYSIQPSPNFSNPLVSPRFS